MIHESSLLRKYFTSTHSNNMLFKNNNAEYWYSREPNFKRILEIIAMDIQVLSPGKLQTTAEKNMRSRDEERKKQEVFNIVYKMGMEMLNEEKERYLIGITNNIDFMRNKFYIKKTATKSFIQNILCPLLKEIESGKIHNWKKYENKIGFWRELGDNEGIQLGKEIYIDPETNKTMIRL